MIATSANPFYRRRRVTFAKALPVSVTKRVIGPATLYLADCFDVLPELSGIGAVVADPPYGIGFKYRSYDDAPERYDAMMARLVPELIRLTDNGPCFVWQSPLKAEKWHLFFPSGYRIIAACKINDARFSTQTCLSWDPVITSAIVRF